jgi:hypothetical protein
MSLNEERTLSHWDMSEMKKLWRTSALAAARTANLPPLSQVEIWVSTFQRKGTILQDPGNALPTVKSLVDGLVKGKFLPEDSGKHVKLLAFLPPQHGRERVELLIKDVSVDSVAP